ncbi:MAG: RDD family protein [Candidatus Dadabacteria bacterium]|nr:MAG: RDD family protein [Candidatus Dadabacteria bacterium]
MYYGEGGSLLTPNYRYAGFLWRVIATLYDNTLLLGLLLVALLLGIKADLSLENWYLLMFGWPVLGAVYYIAFHASTLQATPGKMICRLRVCRSTGEKVGLGAAALRWVCYLVSKIFLFLPFLVCIFHPKKQCLHDLASDVVVVKEARAPMGEFVRGVSLILLLVIASFGTLIVIGRSVKPQQLYALANNLERGLATSGYSRRHAMEPIRFKHKSSSKALRKAKYNLDDIEKMLGDR